MMNFIGAAGVVALVWGIIYAVTKITEHYYPEENEND